MIPRKEITQSAWQGEKEANMNSRIFAVSAAAVLLVLVSMATLRAQETDAEDCKDHPLLSRMKNYYIYECRAAYDELEVYLNDADTVMIEGNRTYLFYALREGSPQPSVLQVRRNHTNALKEIGAALIHERDNYVHWKLVKNGRTAWIVLQIFDDGHGYTLDIVESAAMEQEVTANEMLEALNRDGFIALYIHFDTGKADLKPEAKGTIDQIATLLKENEGLEVSIEGHTDNVGQPAANKILSEQRAKAVMDAVVGSGVSAARLRAVGWGQEKPVADNRSEEGRAKNRRVEIVKKS